MNKISILKILEDTIVDGPGFRTSIYAAGCKHKCTGCHNPESWNIQNGTLMEIDEILEIINKNFLAEVTFSGGDPFFQIDGFTNLAKRVKKETGKNIWCYTGYTYEKIRKTTVFSGMLPYIDVLVDGRFVEKRKDLNLYFCGSSNQRIIDVQKSLDQKHTILWQSNHK